jgi:prolyl-tRNA editing enzyme YbaK/EbsC (Cys-tRNA(Pro) deacylase)
MAVIIWFTEDGMSIDKVRAFFAAYGKEQDIQEFDVSSATVELAAVAVGVIPARIAKTLSFRVGEGCVLIVTAGDAKIDNAKFKARFKTKAKMLPPEEVVEFTGHAIGGVCPFALPKDREVTVYTDRSLQRFETVFPAAGSANSAIELTCDELFRLSNSVEWVDVCKGWQEE